MVQKVPGFSSAVGYWGRSAACTVALNQTAARIRALLQDQLLANGLPVVAWIPVTDAGGTGGGALNGGTGTGAAPIPGEVITTPVVPCTCDKNTTANSDVKCISCFGTRLVPGYNKFLYETLFYSSAEVQSAPFTLTGCELDFSKKPNRVRLSPGATTGTIVTTDKPFANPAGDAWELELAAYKKIAGDSVGLEFSTDGGVTYYAIALTPGPLFGYRGALTGLVKPQGTGLLRFRITMTRTSASSAESPSFEILRVRHVRSADWNALQLSVRKDMAPGQLLFLRTWDQEFVARDVSRGRPIEAMGDRSETAPLDFFDRSITRDTPRAAFDDRGTGPHPLFEYTTGVRATQRYAIYAVNLDSTIQNVLTHQSFSERRIQPGESAAFVF